MAFPNTFANVSTATGAQLDANFNALSANNGSSLVGFLQSGIGAVARNVQSKSMDIVSVLDFGADSTGVADSTSAIQSAVNSSKSVYFPKGSYLISGTISLGLYGQKIYGDGIQSTVITSNSTTLPMISIPNGMGGTEICEMQLTRSVTALSGADGITSLNVTIENANFHDLFITKQYNGISVGSTDWGTLERIVSTANINVGVVVKNASAYGPAQWQLYDVLSSNNGQQGILFQSTTTAPATQMTIGELRGCATFANGGAGLSFAGSATAPIQDIRIVGGFFGQDGNSEIYLDTYGINHVIDGAFVELAGTFGAIPSNLGSGIETTANNGEVLISNCFSKGNSYSGYYLNSDTTLVNCVGVNNGANAAATHRNGLTCGSASAIINLSGGEFSNVSNVVPPGAPATTQQYGIVVSDGSKIIGSAFKALSNVVAPFTATTNATSAQFSNCDLAGVMTYTNLNLVNRFANNTGLTAGSLSAGFGTTPSIIGNGTLTFRIVIGTAPSSSGVITFPISSVNGWNLQISTLNPTAGELLTTTAQTASTVNSATLANYTTSTGAAANWVAGQILICTAIGY